MLRMGIDLGGTKTEGVVIDPAGKILERERRPTPQADGYDGIVGAICTLVRDLERRVRQPCHVGIGTPGALSTRTGALKNSNTVCLNGKPLHTDLSHRLERPIRIANDANCFALAEAVDGAGRGESVVFGVILGTGVGGGIVVNGRLLEGLQHIAGEWGHNVLEADGPACYCGKQGCVETFLSGPGLARSYADAGGESAPDAGAVVSRAASGDATAQAVMTRYIERFGCALAAVINILDPHVIVLGGGMSNIERLYTDGRDAVARHVFNDELRTRIVRNTHGDSAGVLGAAQLWHAGE
jgi:fructokinase